jgi:hypothetical protein
MFCSNRQTCKKKNVLTVQSIWMLMWQGHTTCGRAVRHVAEPSVRHVAGVGWQLDDESFLDTWHVCGEWNGDTWPNQWSPRVTWAVV